MAGTWTPLRCCASPPPLISQFHWCMIRRSWNQCLTRGGSGQHLRVDDTSDDTLSPDDTVIPSLPSAPDDHCQYQEVLQMVTNNLEIPLKEVQDPQHWLLDVLQPQGLPRAALPINEVVLEPVGVVWCTPASCAPTPKKEPKDVLFLPKKLIFCFLILPLSWWWYRWHWKELGHSTRNPPQKAGKSPPPQVSNFV